MAQMLQSPDGGRQVSCAGLLPGRLWVLPTRACQLRNLFAFAAAAACHSWVSLEPCGWSHLHLPPSLSRPCAPCTSQVTKRNLRGDFAREWAEYAGPEADGAWEMLSSPAVVEALGGVLQRLSGGRKPGGAGAGGGQAQSRL